MKKKTIIEDVSEKKEVNPEKKIKKKSLLKKLNNGKEQKF